ncbi:sulfite exporter TauE/SafE family protein [Martelella lutilitoris]|uniref:Probable membrane transporter protein n=1 Tax=Martelella lutilitoris TaxID=2583532 RepID=A0A7T7HIJ2_9HYPH|nr:sulfite exporter TauE/SafE family protein [Martelella lutilitoris]QQM29851.1 sulfite exporter TauE/SafE family protein [Martelella lutilitoris]
MLPDPIFYAAAIPAVLLVGLTKGGMGGALALLGVPILTFVVEPATAAAIMLPILIVMDAVALWTWRRHGHWPTLKALLPGALIGTVLGWYTFSTVPFELTRMLVGLATVAFAGKYFYDRWKPGEKIEKPAKGQRPVAATFWGAIAGYTSFISHSGGPPYQIYTLPLKLDPKSYTGASVRFFAIVNVIKLGPYYALGELGAPNLAASASLLPFAVIATIAGAMVVKRMRMEVFYPFMYAMAFLAGLKLVLDGS